MGLRSLAPLIRPVTVRNRVAGFFECARAFNNEYILIRHIKAHTDDSYHIPNVFKEYWIAYLRL